MNKPGSDEVLKYDASRRRDQHLSSFQMIGSKRIQKEFKQKQKFF